jgi:hypothetical protein
MSKDILPQPDAIDVGVTLGNAITRAVTADLRTAYTNRTFGEFIKAARELGISDHDPLASIEYGVSGTGSGFIRMERDEDGAIEVREVSRSEVG